MNMKPKEMLIVTPPSELHFCGPFNRPNVTTMKLKNPNDQPLLFKIKTTAPKRYCVRPNLGVIDPNETSTVEICLQPFVYDPNEKNKHKFMVQAMISPGLECEDVQKEWKEAEQSGQLMDVKLKCVFEMPANVTASNDTSASATATTDVKKQSPKANNEEKVEKLNFQISNMQTSEQTDSLMDELKQLREENSGLRKDNIKLKDHLERLLSVSSKPRVNEPYTPLMAEKQIPMFYIAIAIAMVILGILLGKYMF